MQISPMALIVIGGGGIKAEAASWKRGRSAGVLKGGGRGVASDSVRRRVVGRQIVGNSSGWGVFALQPGGEGVFYVCR